MYAGPPHRRRQLSMHRSTNSRSSSARMAVTARATSTKASGVVLPCPNGSAMQLRSRTLGPVRGRTKPCRSRIQIPRFDGVVAFQLWSFCGSPSRRQSPPLPSRCQRTTTLPTPLDTETVRPCSPSPCEPARPARSLGPTSVPAWRLYKVDGAKSQGATASRFSPFLRRLRRWATPSLLRQRIEPLFDLVEVFLGRRPCLDRDILQITSVPALECH
jgi:hypothetical protein